MSSDLLRLLTLSDANTRVVLLGTAVLGVACGTIGALAVLRRRALVGDAVAHASLPGVCLAWLVIGDRQHAMLLLGAVLFGLLGVACVAWIRAATRVKEDAAIGLVLAVFFGLGIALSRAIQNLPGGNRAGLDGFILGKAASMVRSDVVAVSIVAGTSLAIVILLYKEFRLLCFDRGFAAAQGWPTGLLDLLLLALVCCCTVAGLPAVGVVLMVSLLVVPGAAARFWTDRLGTTLVVAGGIGLASAVLGTALSATLPPPSGALSRGWPTGPMIALAAAAIFVLSLVAAPRHGLVARWLRRALEAPPDRDDSRGSHASGRNVVEEGGELMTVFEPFGVLVTSDDLWIVATAACCAVACAVLGCFLVLQRLSLLGDAISHAILPGLAVAFILTSSRGVPAMLGGAAVAAMLTAGLSGGLRRLGRIPDDAALGVVFSTLFALGVLLVTWVAGRIDLDPGCVLYGLLELVPFDRVKLAGVEMPRAFVWLAAALAVTILTVTLLFKELRIVCFDPGLATALGVSSTTVNVVLLSLVSATTVVSFEAVGSILVVAMLVGPAATAQLLTDRLRRMPWIAAGLGALSAVVGYLLAVRWNTSVAGMMSVVIGAEFALAAILAPRHGVLSRRLHRFALSLRIAREDLLARLYRQHEFAQGDVPSISEGPEPTTPRWLAVLARHSLRRRGEGAGGAGNLRLTERGLERGRELLRAHRLWESFLARDLGLAPDHLHAPAHREEHFIDASLAEQLQREIGAAVDPHGKPIPAVHRAP